MACLFLWGWLHRRCAAAPRPPGVELGLRGLRILPASDLGQADHHVVDFETSGRAAAGRVTFRHSLSHQAENGDVVLYDFPGPTLPPKLTPRPRQGRHLPLTINEALMGAPSRYSIANH
jgi:hypothetical protein